MDISSDTIGFLSQPNLITFAGTFPDKRAKPNQVVGVGDVLNISIFEAAPGGLFTPGTASERALATSSICRRRPSIRRVASTSLSLERFPLPREHSRNQEAVVARLRNRAIEPQVVMSFNQQHASVVSVLGDVNAPGVLPLNSVGERLLALVARAGGPKFQAIESYVTLQRNGKEARVLLSRIVHDPRENVFIRPNDVASIMKPRPSRRSGRRIKTYSDLIWEIPSMLRRLRCLKRSARQVDFPTFSQTLAKFTSIDLKIAISLRNSASTPGDSFR